MINAILRRFELMQLKKGGLPKEYEQLEFIYGNGNSYIDCGIKPNYQFEYELKCNAVTGNVVVGTDFISDGNDYRFFHVNNMYYFDVGSKRINGLSNKIANYHMKWGNYYIYDVDNDKRVEGTTFDENMNGAIISSNIKLLSGLRIVAGKVWLFKIWDNGKLVRDYIPSRRKSDNVVGLYDLVEGKFYTSATDTPFQGSDEAATTMMDDELETITTEDELIDGFTVLSDGTTYHKETTTE